MEEVKRFLSWCTNTFRASGIIGKIILIFIGLSASCCVCSLPIIIFSPQTSTSKIDPADVASIQTEAYFTVMAGVHQTATSIAPTRTNLPSSTPLPASTTTPIKTSIPSSTPLPTSITNPDRSMLGGDCIPDIKPSLAKVTDIVDGDTIKVSIDGNPYTIRYIGLDTPEIVHPSKPVEYFGYEASDFNKEMVDGKEIFIYKDVSETDQYDRLLRYVIVDGIFVNYGLIRQGYAQASTYPPDISCSKKFLEAQRLAENEGIGLWNISNQSERSMSIIDIPAGETKIEITHIFYDGVEGRQEPDEFVRITNQGSNSVDMYRWSLSDQSGKTFNFPSHQINPGKSCQIYTNSIHQESCGFSFHYSLSAIWNNDGDCATLKDAQGNIIDSYCY